MAHTPARSSEWPVHPERLLQTLLAVAWSNDSYIEHRAALRELEGVAPTIHVTRAAGVGMPMNRYGRYVHSAAKILESECSFSTAPVLFSDSDGPHAVYSYDLPYDPKRDSLFFDLCNQIWYFGESSSSVTVCLLETPPDSMKTLVPDARGEDGILRVPQKGRCDLLERAYARRIAGVAAAVRTSGTMSVATKLRSEPEMATARDVANGKDAWVAMREFRESGDLVSHIHYRELGSLRLSPFMMEASLFVKSPPFVTGENFDVLLSLYRSAWLSSLRLNEPELTGHDDDGSSTKRPHVGFVPLLDVDRSYADGSIQGFGVLIPRDISARLRREAFDTTKRTTLLRGRGYERYRLIDEDTYRKNSPGETPRLRVAKCLRASSRKWATVTPAIPFHFTRGRHISQEENDAVVPTILHMFETSNLPKPAYVYYSPAPSITAAPHISRIARTRTTRGVPNLRHLTFGFNEEIRGPIVLGRRAWKGYGLCLPLN